MLARIRFLAIHTYTHKHTRTQARTHAAAHVQTKARTHTQAHTSTRVHVRTLTHTHARTHARTHTHKHPQAHIHVTTAVVVDYLLYSVYYVLLYIISTYYTTGFPYRGLMHNHTYESHQKQNITTKYIRCYINTVQ